MPFLIIQSTHTYHSHEKHIYVKLAYYRLTRFISTSGLKKPSSFNARSAINDPGFESALDRPSKVQTNLTQTLTRGSLESGPGLMGSARVNLLFLIEPHRHTRTRTYIHYGQRVKAQLVLRGHMSQMTNVSHNAICFRYPRRPPTNQKHMVTEETPD